MAKSRNRKNHTEKLNKRKRMTEEQKTALAAQMPPVRSIPVWANDAQITLTGYEWEAIQNGLINVQTAQQAAQGVMSRNIVEGTIKMDFEKLNAQTLQYEPMSEEEKQPYLDDFNKQIEAFKTAKEKVAEKVTTEPTLVDSTGEAIKEEPKEEAKVVKLG